MCPSCHITGHTWLGLPPCLEPQVDPMERTFWPWSSLPLTKQPVDLHCHPQVSTAMVLGVTRRWPKRWPSPCSPELPSGPWTEGLGKQQVSRWGRHRPAVGGAGVGFVHPAGPWHRSHLHRDPLGGFQRPARGSHALAKDRSPWERSGTDLRCAPKQWLRAGEGGRSTRKPGEAAGPVFWGQLVGRRGRAQGWQAGARWHGAQLCQAGPRGVPSCLGPTGQGGGC